MSREVIGAGTTVTDHARPRLPRHGVHPAAVTDLDAPEAPSPAGPELRTPAPRARPRARWLDVVPGWLARPAGVVAITLAALLVGVLLGAGATERAAADRQGESLRLLGGLTFSQLQFSGSAEGLPIDLLVINAGPETVRVTDATLTDSTSTLSLREAFEVAPGEAARGEGLLELDCTRRGGGGEVVATVATPDGRRHAVTLAGTQLQTDMLDLSDSGFLCGLGPVSTLEVSGTVVRADGSISIQVRNSGDEAVELSFEAPDGVTVVGDPPFPFTLGANSAELLIVRAQVEACTRDATRADASTFLALLVDGQRDQAFLDPVITAGWLARQVALVCG